MKELSPFTHRLTINLEPVYGIILAQLLFREEGTATAFTSEPGSFCLQSS